MAKPDERFKVIGVCKCTDTVLIADENHPSQAVVMSKQLYDNCTAFYSDDNPNAVIGNLIRYMGFNLYYEPISVAKQCEGCDGD